MYHLVGLKKTVLELCCFSRRKDIKWPWQAWLPFLRFEIQWVSIEIKRHRFANSLQCQPTTPRISFLYLSCPLSDSAVFNSSIRSSLHKFLDFTDSNRQNPMPQCRSSCSKSLQHHQFNWGQFRATHAMQTTHWTNKQLQLKEILPKKGDV